ncbi:uncharacterized protein [Acropora muricata]|uniref:uncharacterized protein n=1 Tax=Acropora muricata TaxID=159855 RepID=UPI0034E5F7B5
MRFRLSEFCALTIGYIFLIPGATCFKPGINPGKRYIVTSRGSNVTLVCLGSSVNPLDSLSEWKLNGRKIKNSPRVRASEQWFPDATGNFSLHIANVSEKDVGIYTCAVSVATFEKTVAAEGFIKLKLYSSLRWPRGTYALPMAVTGCPKSRRILWSEGYLRQNTEDTSPLNNWSRPMHLKGLKKNNEITQHFCVKNKRAGHRDWPKGKYCIYKKGKCPIGFSEGWIKWDDEDTKNSNLASGERPDGTYREDTLLYFCCRSDGSADTPIELPMRLPFFLLKHASKCQAVMGMRVIEEWLFWDCEDKENKNRWSGELPESLLAKDIKLFFCYYSQM